VSNLSQVIESWLQPLDRARHANRDENTTQRKIPEDPRGRIGDPDDPDPDGHQVTYLSSAGSQSLS